MDISLKTMSMLYRKKEKKKKKTPKRHKEGKEAGKGGKTEGGRKEEDTFLSENNITLVLWYLELCMLF